MRLFHLSEELRVAGHEVSVVTCRNRRLLRFDPGLQPDVRRLHTVPAWDWRSVRLRLAGNGSPAVSQSVKDNRWVQWLARAQDSFPFSLLLGEGGPVYIWLAYRRACRLVRRYDLAYIFTSYRPVADHWVGFLLKRRFPKLCWIADFRDLHVDPTRKNVFWPRWQTRIDRWMLRRANLATTVSYGLAARLPVPRERIQVLRNAIPAGLLNRRAKATDHFTIVYTGALYPGLQEAGLLFRTLTGLLDGGKILLDHLRLVYLGKDGGVWDEWMEQYRLTGQSVNRGEMSRADALAQQSESSLNLLLNWSSPQLQGVLTSKVYEYLAAGVPMLAIINGVADAETEEIVVGTGAGRVFYHREEQRPLLEEYLLTCYEEWRRTGVVRSKVEDRQLQAYSWPEQARRLLAVLAGDL